MKIALLFLLIFQLNTTEANQTQRDSVLNYAWQIKYLNNDSARLLINQVMGDAKQDADNRSEAKAYSFIGVLEDIAGNSDKAIEYLLKARQIQEKHDFTKDLSFTYNNLGIAFFFQYDYQNALEYYLLSIEIDKALGDSLGVAGTLANTAIIYTYLDSIDRAREMYDEAFAIYEARSDSSGIAVILNNRGKLYYGERNFHQALENYRLSMKYNYDFRNPDAAVTAYHSMASSYFEMGIPDSALHYCLLSNDFALEYQMKERLQYGYELLADIYLEKEEYQNAVQSLKQYTALRDSIVNEDRSRVIAEMQTKYETEKKDRQIAQIELEKLENERERNFFIATSIAVLFATFFLTYAFRTNKRKNALLEERNKAVEENLHRKETMIGEIHHRIKNNLQVISSIFDLQSRTLKDEEAIRAINDSKNRVKAMAIIHQKLYQQTDIYGIDMKEYIENLSDAIIDTFKTSPEEVSVHYDITPISLHIDSSIPIGLIITEILTNAIKYAFPDGKKGNIYIRLHQKESLIILEVKDDGVGLDNSHSTKDSTSFGMKMIKSLARQLKADWSVSGDAGTCYVFNISNFRLSE